MKVRASIIFSSSLAAACTALSVLVYDRLPATVAVHWNAYGEPDGHGPKFLAAALMPVLILVLPALFSMGRSVLPRAGHIERSQGAIDTAINSMAIILTVVHAMMLGIALGYAFPVHKIAIGCIGLALATVGNVLGKTRSNHLIGIRTPWTMASETVWDKTNRLGGRVLVVEGLACLLAAPFLPTGSLAAMGMLAMLIATIVALAWYSYALFRRETAQQA